MVSLRYRLLLILLVVVLAALGTAGWFASQATRSEFDRSLNGVLSYRTFNLDAVIHALLKTIDARRGDRAAWEAIQATVERLSQTTRTRLVLADLDGVVRADSNGDLSGTLINRELSRPLAVFLIEGEPILMYAEPKDAPQLEAIRVQFADAVNRSLLLAIAVGLGLALLLTLVFSSSLLRPIQALTDAARRMGQGDLSTRVAIRDRSEVGELAEAFNAMADGLQRLEKLRRNMVGDVAHELRTPLANIRGYLEAMRDGMVEPDRAALESLHEEALLLSQLVDDLQDLALVEAGQLRLEMQPVDLAGLASRSLGALQPQIAAKQLRVELDFPPGLPAAYADARRVSQVLRNLLSNAIRYTPAGGEIRISGKADETMITVSVQDSGEGIPLEHIPNLFERFYRVDPSRSRQTGGYGLGLAIVRQLVQAQGGDVSVDSQPGRGARFNVSLPVSA